MTAAVWKTLRTTTVSTLASQLLTSVNFRIELIELILTYSSTALSPHLLKQVLKIMMSVTPLQSATVKVVIGCATAAELVEYKAAIAEREIELDQQGWRAAMAATVAELRTAPGFADKFGVFLNTMRYSDTGNDKLFCDEHGEKYHVWYQNSSSDVRIRRVTNVDAKKMTLQMTKLGCNCTGDIRTVPLSIFDFANALIVVDLDKMIERHRRK